MLNGMRIVELKGVSKAYLMGGVPVFALNKVALAIEDGEYVAVMGTSGSGKSTLLNILGGVDFPSEGEVYLGNVRIDTLPEKDLLTIRRRMVAYIFQEARLLSSLTAVDNVMLPLAFTQEKKDKKQALKMLAKVGLEKRANHHPHQLSGGEAQRVCIARALMTSPSLVLADEPTGNLDSKTGEEIMNLFGELNREGMAIVMVTHDPQKASHARRVIRLADGVMVEDTLNRKYTICQA